MLKRRSNVAPMEVAQRLTLRHVKSGVKADLPVISKLAYCEDDVNSMHRSMCWVLLVAQAFGLCPVRGITGHRAEDLSYKSQSASVVLLAFTGDAYLEENGKITKFTWRSLRVLYSTVVIVALLISLGFSFSWFIVVGLTFTTSGSMMFYITGLACSTLFLKLGTKWPELALLWQRTEHSQIRYGYPKNLRLKIRTLTVIILSLALGSIKTQNSLNSSANLKDAEYIEHMLSNANRIYIASQCSAGGFDLVRRYIVVTHRHVFGVIGYSTVMAVFTSVVNIISSLYWSYADVFVMLISMALASRFRLLNLYLKQAKGKVRSEDFWRSAREDYNSLSRLTSSVDSCVSSIVLLCFATDLFFICQQLLNSMNHYVSTIQTVYFYLSFGYLLLRTIAMALYAASVYDESRVAKDVLYAVPAHNYQVEVHRFLVQVATDNIALTGLNFFPVTRTVLLTLAGTIVTYEVVLVQFGTTSDNSSSNMTALCLDLTGGHVL